MAKLIYIASPYTDDYPEIVTQRVKDVTEFAGKLTSEGLHVISPVVHSHQLVLSNDNLPKDWDYWKTHLELLLSKCDVLLVYCLNHWKDSTGMYEEILFAAENNIQTVYATETDDIAHVKQQILNDNCNNFDVVRITASGDEIVFNSDNFSECVDLCNKLHESKSDHECYEVQPSDKMLGI